MRNARCRRCTLHWLYSSMDSCKGTDQSLHQQLPKELSIWNPLVIFPVDLHDSWRHCEDVATSTCPNSGGSWLLLSLAGVISRDSHISQWIKSHVCWWCVMSFRVWRGQNLFHRQGQCWASTSSVQIWVVRQAGMLCPCLDRCLRGSSWHWPGFLLWGVLGTTWHQRELRSCDANGGGCLNWDT